MTITEINRIQIRTLCPFLAAINRILIAVMDSEQR
jgi:hypothetical protein